MAHPVAVTTPRARKTTTPRDSREVVERLEAADWRPQPSTDNAAHAWQGPAAEDGASLFIGGVSPQPALNFPSWSDYLDPDEVLILGGLGV